MEMSTVELMEVLTEGSKNIRELESCLGQPFSSPEACKTLLAQVQSALAKAIAVTKFLEQQKSLEPPPANYWPEGMFREQERKERCKKRKTLPRWSGQVSACSGSAMEGPVDDGCSWRKYGQKDILGARFPRGYYRCTYRNSHGCVATKQVQRTDDDPSVFGITYRGAHTCSHGVRAPGEEERQQELLQSLKTGLRVKTEGLGSGDGLLECSSFSFPEMPENGMSTESNVLPYAAATESFMCCDSEISGIFSASASTTSSPMVGMDFGWEQLCIESEIPYDFC